MKLTSEQKRTIQESSFLVTGGAGFIGSHIVESLLNFGAKAVRVLDNLATGDKKNIEQFMSDPRFEFILGDIRDEDECNKACYEMDFVSHQAALGSVPRSLSDPKTTNDVNITGHLNMLNAVKNNGVKRMIYAASSSTYGDSEFLPKVEDRIGKPLSPYAVTKYVNELYANVFAKSYNTQTIGLRYFNVFGPRQNPNGQYAAVIPLFIKFILNDLSPTINGDGEQTRDFTFVENVVQANILGMLVNDDKAVNQVYNIACGERISLNQLVASIKRITGNDNVKSVYRDARAGDIKDSLAEIKKAKDLLGYKPEINLQEGLEITINYWKNKGI
jgi:UDP-N-acetylglucosamine 4-epimerase